VGFFTAIYNALLPLQNANVHQDVTPTTGSTVTMQNQAMYLMLTPAGTLASLTINLPNNPTDAEPIEITTTKTITALTLAAPISTGSITINNAPTTLAAGSSIKLVFNLAQKAWFAFGGSGGGGTTTGKVVFSAVFDATVIDTTTGATTLISQFNVSGVTSNGVGGDGTHTVNFTSAVSANYCIAVICGPPSGNTGLQYFLFNTPTTTSCKFVVVNQQGQTGVAPTYCSVIGFSNP
jgi:hypothetical protein